MDGSWLLVSPSSVPPPPGVNSPYLHPLPIFQRWEGIEPYFSIAQYIPWIGPIIAIGRLCIGAIAVIWENLLAPPSHPRYGEGGRLLVQGGLGLLPFPYGAALLLIYNLYRQVWGR